MASGLRSASPVVHGSKALIGNGTTIGGRLILRWMAAGLMEAGKGFRRVRAYQGMARLSPALERNDERIDGKLKVEEAA